MSHPRDRYITVFGRKPVLEALGDDRLEVDKVLLARGARGPVVQQIQAAAKARGLKVDRRDDKQINRISRSARHDQGAVCDVIAPRMEALETYLDRDERGPLLLLDAVHNPANVGMVLRAATAAGMHGVILPRLGCPDVGPLVIKASAGVAFRSPILRCPSALHAAEALIERGYSLVGLRGDEAEDLYDAQLDPTAVFVLGNETEGVSGGVAKLISQWVRIPMANGVESLNVATAGAVVAFEIARRGRANN